MCPACLVPGVTLGLHRKDHFGLSLKAFKLWFNMIKMGVLLKLAVFFFQTAPTTHTDACLKNSTTNHKCNYPIFCLLLSHVLFLF